MRLDVSVHFVIDTHPPHEGWTSSFSHIKRRVPIFSRGLRLSSFEKVHLSNEESGVKFNLGSVDSIRPESPPLSLFAK